MAIQTTVPAASAGPKGWAAVLRSSDLLLAMGMVAVVAMMIVPLPTLALDVLISVNLTFALLTLMMSLYVSKPLEFSTFPVLLLILTLFRLALNVSTTRSILLRGDGGHVIEAFGSFVVGGNYAVGIIIFVILVVIQFMVITNGAGRISEVAARFTLDAMPGKQMAIDADLNSGLINEGDARKRRSEIQREADFYGTMDGASKFVKGDAIAGIIIVLVNILGGLAVGVLQHGMDPATAASRFTLMSIGDGLVSQIPALVISVAMGILVTKVSAETALGDALGKQMFGNPRALGLVAGLMGAMVLVMPGATRIPFVLLAGALGTGAWVMSKQQAKAQEDAELKAAMEAEVPADPKGPENVMTLLSVDPMELEIGYRLIPLVDAAQGGDLLERITMIRRQTASKMGVVLPPIRVRDNLQLKPKEYRINLRGIKIAGGEIHVDHYMAMNAGMAMGEVEGIPTTEPVFGLPAFWIHESKKEDAELMGYTVFDPSSVVATHLTEVIKIHAPDILSRQDVQALLNNVKQEYPAVVEELVPDLLTLGEIQRVLQNLLRERVSIRDLVPVLEALANYARLTKDSDTLTEYARQALARAITHQFLAPDGKLPVVTLDPGLEQILGNSIQQTDQGAFVTLEPGVAQRLLKNAQTQMERMAAQGHQPVVLCSSKVRLVFRRLLERKFPQMGVLAYNEIVPPQTEVQALGTLSVGG